jgi:patatin-like phospholipase/acyl hydrolase
MTFKYKILSIDGGGIRGIIPAMIIAEIERRTNKPICQLFDMIAGTSTGGILALGLTKPHPDNPQIPHYKAKELIDLYREEGKRIFHQDWIDRHEKLRELFLKPKFASNGREEVLAEYLGKETRIQDALAEVLITSYETELRIPVYFTSNKEAEKTSGLDFHRVCQSITMVEAAMATSAAPTYFEPVLVPTDNKPNGFYSLIDGGVFANNPTSLAIMEAIIASKKKARQLRQPDKKLALDEILVVSIGTGSLTREYEFQRVKRWGQAQWIQPIINIVMDGQSEAVGSQLDQLLPDAEGDPKQYYRFQPRLTKGNDDIDDPSPENLQKLEERANLVIDARTDKLEELCKLLVETPTVVEREMKLVAQM